jgi:hypothetical protein
MSTTVSAIIPDREISEVTVGDRVLAADFSGETLFSDVVFVPHGARRVLSSLTSLLRVDVT